jgi:hypothetical protein
MKIITRYKLTDQQLQTHNWYQWKVGEWVKTDGSGELCGPGWLHCYEHPLLAVLHNPIHANIHNPILWAAEVRGLEKRDGEMKAGWTEMRLIRRVKIPVLTIDQHIKYGIRCAMAVYQDSTFLVWAKNWLSGKDRSTKSAAEASSEFDVAARGRADTAAGWAAAAAGWAAAAAGMAAAVRAGEAAGWAVMATARAGEKKISLAEIAKKIYNITSERPE